VTELAASSPTEIALAARVRELEARLVGEEKLAAMLASVTAERDKLRRAYEALKTELELMKRRIFVAKAERIDVTQLELEFDATKARLDEMA
jgi:transposase